MKKYKYSNKINILHWGNKTDYSRNPSFYLLKHNFLDIKFTVYISDFSFKFMPFDLCINGEQFFLMLPITLLDMSMPHPISHQIDTEKYTLRGTSLCC